MLKKYKEPGIRPPLCGTIFIRLWGGCCLDADTDALARDTWGKLQMGAGLKAGIKGNIHSVHVIWMESAAWTQDCNKDVE